MRPLLRYSYLVNIGNIVAKRFLFIHSESTPNLYARKFIPQGEEGPLYFFQNQSLASPAFEWKSSDDNTCFDNKNKDLCDDPSGGVELVYNSFPSRDPPKKLIELARNLLGIPGLSRIFIGKNFLTATMAPLAPPEWPKLSPKIISILDSFFSNNFIPDSMENDSNQDVTDESPTSEAIRQLLDTKVRPYIQNDGGDVAFISFIDGIVRVELHGACSTCATSQETLKQGVTAMLKYYIPEVIDVIDVNEETGIEEGQPTPIKAFKEFEKALQDSHSAGNSKD